MHLAKVEENNLGAWAWKCTIKDKNANEGLLKGKTLAIKDCIAIKGVPFLLGTEMFKDYIPVSKCIWIMNLTRFLLMRNRR